MVTSWLVCNQRQNRDKFEVRAAIIYFCKANTEVELRGAMRDTLLLVRLVRGARFLAMCGGGTVMILATISDDDACRFAKDDVVEEVNEERRFWVDIF